MAITCNFERDDKEIRDNDRQLIRIAPGQVVGTDTPGLKPARAGAYLWIMDHRRRQHKSWRDQVSVN